MAEAITKAQLEQVVTDILDARGEKMTDAIMEGIMKKLEPYFDKVDKKFFGQKGEEKPGFKTFGEQLQAVRKACMGGGQDVRLKAASGLNEADPSSGGFLVQDDFAAELIKQTHDVGILSSRCRRIPISAKANGLILNAVDESSRVNGSRWGGVQVYWTNEAEAVTASKPKFRQMKLELEKLTGVYYATEEILADTTALESIVMQAFSEEFAYKVDEAILSGAGAGQPLGILKSKSLIKQAIEAGQDPLTVIAENIMNMWNRMPARQRMGSEWFINQDVEPQMWTMSLKIGTGGVPLYVQPGGLSQLPYGQLFGRPVIPIEQAEALGTIGDVMLLNMKEYLLIDKGGINAAESLHVRFLQGEDTFRFVYRCDGEPLWNSTLTAAKGGTTRSPFIALDSRPAA